jgi:hypothetical protein
MDVPLVFVVLSVNIGSEHQKHAQKGVFLVFRGREGGGTVADT